MARTDVKSTTRALAGDCGDDDVDYDGSDDCGRGVGDAGDDDHAGSGGGGSSGSTCV